MTKLLAAVATLLCLPVGLASLGDRLPPYEAHYQNVLGTSLDLKILAFDEVHAQQAEDAVLTEMERLSKILSSYDHDSEFSRWFRTNGQPVRVSSELFEVLSMFDRWRDNTGGALNPATEAASRVWKLAAKEGVLPANSQLASAVQSMQQQHWKLNPELRAAEHTSTVPLAMNSFVKSYIVSRAADAALHQPHVTGVVVNSGGDLVVRGQLTERVQIADPVSDSENSPSIVNIFARETAVATSGNYRRGVEIGGRHYSHIFDPRTAVPAEEVVSSTVVASNATEAGALATAFSVMAPAESAALAKSMPGVEYFLVLKDGRQVASGGWPALAFARAPVNPFLAAAAPPPGSDPSMELTVALELARIESARAKRPYLAVWIEDQDHFPLRTVALWFEKSRWLPDLKAWYKDDRLRAMAEGSDISKSVSSATRPAGKYTLKWDGKDNAGKLVKAGKYTVMIEAAREHGTYQLIHQELDWNGTTKQVSLPGGTEIASAALDVHKVGR